MCDTQILFAFYLTIFICAKKVICGWSVGPQPFSVLSLFASIQKKDIEARFMGPQSLARALKRFDKHIRCLGPGLGRGLMLFLRPFYPGCNLLCFINIFDETLPLVSMLFLLFLDILGALCCLLCGFRALIIRPVVAKIFFYARPAMWLVFFTTLKPR